MAWEKVIIMAGVRKKPIQGGKYQGWFIDAMGKRRFFTGTRAKTETLRIAQRLEDEHRQVRLGYRIVLPRIKTTNPSIDGGAGCPLLSLPVDRYRRLIVQRLR